MPPLEVGAKFSCFAFDGFPCTPELQNSIDLGGDVWALRRAPVELEDHWREWLGSLRADLVRRANFLLWASVSARQPDVYDDENQTLTRRVNHLFYGLLLQGVPRYLKRGISLSGANVAGTVHIRHVSDLRDPEPSFDIPPFTVGEPEVRRALLFAAVLNDVDRAQPDWRRLRRGLSALFRGFRSLDGGDRLHQFVRALEAILKPEIGRTRTQFVHRAQTITGASETRRAILGELFDLRSQVEHLHSPLDALSGSEADRIAIANQRTRQADVLSRFALAHVLDNRHLLDILRTDVGLDAFWSRPDHERAAIWGAQCRIETIL